MIISNSEKVINILDEGPVATFLMSLIFLSIALFTIETLPHLTEESRKYIQYIEYFILTCFGIEYLTRACCQKWTYIKSWWGILDFIAVVPAMLCIFVPAMLCIDLKFVRILRVVRIFKLFKNKKFKNAVEKLCNAYRTTKEELIVAAVLALIVIYLCAVGVYYCEHQEPGTRFVSILHSLWWAVVTLTTVGYGDMAPVTFGGRFFTVFMLFAGLAIVAVPTGLITSALTDIRNEEKNSQQNDNQAVNEKIDDRNQYS